MKDDSLNLSLVLLEVLRGYSVFSAKGKKFYFKHFLVSENLALDEFEQEEFEQAQRDGIKSEKDLIKDAIEKKYWSKTFEDKIESLKWTINKAEIAASKINDNIQKQAFNSSIQKQRDELSDLELRRSNIIRYSAENCASHKKNIRLIETSVFLDKELTIAANLDEAYLIMPDLNKKLADLSNEHNLIKAAYINSFFELYSLSYRDPLALIKKDLFTITVLQKNLLMYASIILNRLKNVDMPEDIKNDPIKIIKYQKSDDSSGAKKSEGIEDLREKMSRNNGQLKAEDLLS